MASRIHSLVQNADDDNHALADGVIDSVTVDEEYVVARAHRITGHAQFRVVCQGANALVQFVEVLVGLGRIPLAEAVFPDTDQVQFRQGRFVDGKLQARLADLARALRLISRMFKRPASPLFSPSIRALRRTPMLFSRSSSSRKLARITSLTDSYRPLFIWRVIKPS